MSQSPQWAVELDAFGKSYPAGWARAGRPAVAGVSLKLARGQVLGLLGPNGSGKSTTLKALAGLVRPTEGTCRILGAEAGSDAARAQVGYLPEALRFPPRHTARELLRYFAALSGLAAAVARDRIEAVLDWSDLATVAAQPVATFSKGMRQRLGLAQAVIHQPAVVLLDEPASGLDPAGRLALNRMIRDLAAEDRTVVFTAHLLAQAESLCDRIAVLGHGRLLAEGTLSELLGPCRPVPAELSALEKFYLEKTRAPR